MIFQRLRNRFNNYDSKLDAVHNEILQLLQVQQQTLLQKKLLTMELKILKYLLKLLAQAEKVQYVRLQVQALKLH